MAIGKSNLIFTGIEVESANFNFGPLIICRWEFSASVDVLLVGQILNSVIEKVIAGKDTGATTTRALIRNGETILLRLSILK